MAGGSAGVGMGVSSSSSSSAAAGGRATVAGAGGATSSSFLNMSVDAGSGAAPPANGTVAQKKFSELFPQAMNGSVKLTPHVFSTTQRQRNSKKIGA